jgi:hypothetical protein
MTQAPIGEFARRLVAVAEGEERTFGGVPETDTRLKKRIYDTYLAELRAADPHNELGWAMSPNITKWAWSATFVSWCMLAAGAARTEFALSVRHAMYIKAAIANQDAGQGLFRAHPIADYAPQLGDVITMNRGGGKVTYDQARTLKSYDSHGAIVVALIERMGKKYAVTIGGNEGQSVRRTEVALTADGRVKPRAEDPFIGVIQTLKDSAPAIAAPPPPAQAAAPQLSAAFRRHGSYIYDAAATIADYGSIDLLVAAMQRAGMSHAWVRIHGTQPYGPTTKQLNRQLISALKTGGIAVAGWGWCQGATPLQDAAMALRECAAYGLQDYIADIEPGHSNSQWTVAEVQAFCGKVRQGLAGSFALSTFALVDWHEPHLLTAALPFVDAVAPQIYWFDYPNQRMLDQFRRPDGTAYPAKEPGAYVDLCLDRWAKAMAGTQKPIVFAGQAYWGEGNTQMEAEAKLNRFLASWSAFDRVVGINWWHFGGSTGMSHAMFEAIVAADLDSKF